MVLMSPLEIKYNTNKPLEIMTNIERKSKKTEQNNLKKKNQAWIWIIAGLSFNINFVNWNSIVLVAGAKYKQSKGN